MPKGSNAATALRDDVGRFARTDHQPLTCKACGGQFWRPKTGESDARRFCSRACGFAFQKQRAAESTAERAIARHIDLAINDVIVAMHRQEREARPRVCRCGAPIMRSSASFCDACIGDRIRRGGPKRTYAGRHVAGSYDHVCPNCGATFRGYEADVYCSKHCFTRYTHQARRGAQGERYPLIQGLSLATRNQVAGMISLVRAAHQKIDTERKRHRVQSAPVCSATP